MLDEWREDTCTIFRLFGPRMKPCNPCPLYGRTQPCPSGHFLALFFGVEQVSAAVGKDAAITLGAVLDGRRGRGACPHGR